MPQLDADTRYIFTHIAASYAYIGDAGFHGYTTGSLEATGVLAYINYLFGQENPPVAAISLNSDYENAYLNEDIQKTKTFQLNGDHRNYVSLNLPSYVTYHNASDGKSQTGGTVKIYGGGRFYFTAPKTVTDEWNSGKLTGQIGAQWKTLVLSTGSTTQDIGGKEVIGAKLTIKDAEGNEAAPWITDGKVHQIDRLKPGDYVLIEEQAPDGYEIAEEIPFTVLETGESQKVEMVDEYEKTGTITVDKVGDMLTGISTYDSDFGKINRMEYEKRFLPDIEFSIYDIDGNIVDTITTAEEGKEISKNLPLGEYVLKETKTPAGLAMNHKKYGVVLTKDKKNEVVDISLGIENDVIDTEINVYKVGEMLNPENGTFGYGKS